MSEPKTLTPPLRKFDKYSLGLQLRQLVCFDRSTDQMTNSLQKCQLVSSINQSIDQSINQSINQSIKKSKLRRLNWAQLREHSKGVSQNAIESKKLKTSFKKPKKKLEQEKFFELASESVKGMNSSKRWRQLVPSTRGAAAANERSPKFRQAVLRMDSACCWNVSVFYFTRTWHCDRARRDGSEACSGGRCGRRRDEVGQTT